MRFTPQVGPVLTAAAVFVQRVRAVLLARQPQLQERVDSIWVPLGLYVFYNPPRTVRWGHRADTDGGW